MATDIKKLNNWFSNHGWHRDNRGYEQYLWKEQETCFITHFDGKKYRQINETTVLIWPSAKKISTTNRSFWRSNDGEEMDRPSVQGFCYAFTPEEFAKIKELYDALNNELQIVRKNKNDSV